MFHTVRAWKDVIRQSIYSKHVGTQKLLIPSRCSKWVSHWKCVIGMQPFPSVRVSVPITGELGGGYVGLCDWERRKQMRSRTYFQCENSTCWTYKMILNTYLSLPKSHKSFTWDSHDFYIHAEKNDGTPANRTHTTKKENEYQLAYTRSSRIWRNSSRFECKETLHRPFCKKATLPLQA